MILRTIVRDCLQLNWALPLASVSEAPAPLRYEVHDWDGEPWIFASALLFRHERLQLESVPAFRLSYPQFNLQLCVTDGDRQPAVLYRSVLVPSWVVPAARWIGRQPAVSARFAYPEPIGPRSDPEWRWRVERGRRFQVAGRPGASAAAEGPCVGSWEACVGYFRSRRRGYVVTPAGLRRLESSQGRADVVPMAVEIEERDLLDDALALSAGRWPTFHSAWLCPEVPFVFEILADLEPSLVRHVPAPG